MLAGSGLLGTFNAPALLSHRGKVGDYLWVQAIHKINLLKIQGKGKN